jgi:tRNA (guanine26-N2/guanine27-N2)-dimethyltransferase
MDVVCEKELNKAEDQIDDLSKEATKPSWKVTRELKPPLVLEVRLLIPPSDWDVVC